MRRHRTVLIAEDEIILAMDVEAAMVDALLEQDVSLGATVVSTVKEGLDALDRERFDFALIDVVLGDGYCDELLVQLAARGVPIVLYTGMNGEALKARYGRWPMLFKPYALNDLKALLWSQFQIIDSQSDGYGRYELQNSKAGPVCCSSCT